MPYRLNGAPQVKCQSCKQLFTQYNSRQLVCSPECARKRKTAKQRTRRTRRPWRADYRTRGY